VPELPEVETARRLIADQALGRRTVAVNDASGGVHTGDVVAARRQARVAGRPGRRIKSSSAHMVRVGT
jgi:formamidopyrimidine-DNA glycosylase